MYRDLIVTECTSGILIAALHDVALPEIESVFAGRRPTGDDRILVAWQRGEPVGYIASTAPDVGEVTVWEHGVVPSRRQQGVGGALLRELAKRAPSGSIVVIDPAGQLDPDRMTDYYSRVGFIRGTSEHLWATATDILQATPDIEERPTPTGLDTVGDLLRSKHSKLVTIDPDATVTRAIEILNANRIGALPVVRNDIELVGIFSERDLLGAIGESGSDALDLPLTDLMSTDVVVCSIDDTTSTLMSLMTHRRIRHLPVVENDRLIAMISIGDVVRCHLDRATEENERIHEYIRTGR